MSSKHNSNAKEHFNKLNQFRQAAYGSGVVCTKVTEWGEFVLAELTQAFDQADVSYFKPLMAITDSPAWKSRGVGHEHHRTE